MLIVHLDFFVAPERRADCLAVLAAEGERLAGPHGPLMYRPMADLTDERLIVLVEEWASEADFAAYVAGPVFAETGVQLRPLAVQPPVSRRYRADLLETVA